MHHVSKFPRLGEMYPIFTELNTKYRKWFGRISHLMFCNKERGEEKSEKVRNSFKSYLHLHLPTAHNIRL